MYKMQKNKGCLTIVIIAFAMVVVMLFLGNILSQLDYKWSLFLLFIILVVVFLIDNKEKKNRKIQVVELKKVGKLVFKNSEDEFEEFYSLFESKFKEFLTKYKVILQEYDNFNLKKLKPIEVLYIFADLKAMVHLTDWNGEENEGEIEVFFEQYLKIKPIWSKVTSFRSLPKSKKLSSKKFILGLFKAIDEDLKVVNQKLIFFNLEWDAYVYTSVDIETYNQIKNKSMGIHSVGKFFRNT